LRSPFVTQFDGAEGDRYSQNFRPWKTKHLSPVTAGVEALGGPIGGRAGALVVALGLAGSVAIALHR
jgi:hypothetical protein